MTKPSIKIISMPAGEAPEEIREAWVGLVIPLTDHPLKDPRHIGVLGGAPSKENEDGYEVTVTDALNTLRQAGKTKVANWWFPHLIGRGHLVFGKKFCELIKS